MHSMLMPLPNRSNWQFKFRTFSFFSYLMRYHMLSRYKVPLTANFGFFLKCVGKNAICKLEIMVLQSSEIHAV